MVLYSVTCSNVELDLEQIFNCKMHYCYLLFNSHISNKLKIFCKMR